MTNEQLKLLIDTIVISLERAIKETDSNLGLAPRHKKLKLRCIGNSGGEVFFKDSSQWEETEGMAIALDPLIEVVEDLKCQAQALSN